MQATRPEAVGEVAAGGGVRPGVFAGRPDLQEGSEGEEDLLQRVKQRGEVREGPGFGPISGSATRQ